MSYVWYMARRLYSQSGGRKRASRTAIAIATAGVAIGLAIMIVSVSVVHGFKRQVEDKVCGIGAHMQVLNYESLYRPEAQPIALSDTLLQAIRTIPEVKHAQPYCQKTGMLKTDQSFQGVLFRGIGEDYDLSFLCDNLTDGSIQKPFSSTGSTGRLVISQRLANQLHLQVGSRVYAYFFDRTLRARRFTVEAIYATHLSEYDNRLVFCDYHTAHQLLDYEDDQCSGVEISLYETRQLSTAAQQVVSLVNHRQDTYGAYYTAPTIRETYPHIFAWLQLLDLNVLVILALMLAVAGFTTVSGLLIIILERTQFIGVMKALGSSNSSLRHLFILYAILIIGRGMILGNLIGLGLCFLQQTFGFVRLDATTYYVDAVPILIPWGWVLVINVATFLLSVLSLLLPSHIVSRIHPARSIRFE